MHYGVNQSLNEGVRILDFTAFPQEIKNDHLQHKLKKLFYINTNFKIELKNFKIIRKWITIFQETIGNNK